MTEAIMIEADTETLPLKQVFNFRDVGGFSTTDGRRVRTGRLFRSDGLYRLVDADRDVLDPIGLRTVIDLRTDGEVDKWGLAPTEVTGAEVHHLPVLRTTWDRDAVDHATDAVGFLADRYLEMLDEGRERFAEVFELIADESRHGVVFHCAAGKDRTGVTAAIVLSLLDVADDVIAADYAATAPAVARMLEWYRVEHPEYTDAMSQQPPAFMACPPGAMLRFLDGVRERFGSVEELVRDHFGVEADSLDALRRSLLD